MHHDELKPGDVVSLDGYGDVVIVSPVWRARLEGVEEDGRGDGEAREHYEVTVVPIIRDSSYLVTEEDVLLGSGVAALWLARLVPVHCIERKTEVNEPSVVLAYERWVAGERGVIREVRLGGPICFWQKPKVRRQREIWRSRQHRWIRERTGPGRFSLNG